MPPEGISVRDRLGPAMMTDVRPVRRFVSTQGVRAVEGLCEEKAIAAARMPHSAQRPETQLAIRAPMANLSRNPDPARAGPARAKGRIRAARGGARHAPRKGYARLDTGSGERNVHRSAYERFRMGRVFKRDMQRGSITGEPAQRRREQHEEFAR